MKKNVLIIGVMIFTLIIASMSFSAEWTIMVYCDADNNLDQAGVEDLNELEYSGSTDSVNMIFLLDRYGWNDTKLYYVLHDPAGNPGGTDMNIISQDISSDAPWLASEEDMGNPQTLQDFVVWTIQNYPANHYLLSIWDHGSGIFKEVGMGITKGECWDDHGGVPGEYIDLAELRGVLAAAYVANGNQKIDIVGHDVCLLGQIETFYQMKDYVKIGIAAEESEPFDGWEYGPPFYDLKNNPLMSPARLAQKIVEYYCERYGTYTYIIQAAIDLSTLESNLIPQLNTFSELLTYYMYDYQSDIASARSSAEYYNWDCGRNPDLYHFAQLIHADADLPDTLRSSAQDLMACYPSVVISECHGDWSPNAHGMSIWFPDNFLTNYCKDDYLTLIEFAQEGWDEFLAMYDEPQQAYDGPVWYVSPTGDDTTGDGSPIRPFRTIQKGINTASNSDTVLVTLGHYYERINFNGKAILVASNFIFDKSSTTIDSTIIDADTSVLGVSDTGSVVVFVSGEDSTSVIKGFTIQNGIGTLDGFGNRRGGGIYCDSSSATITNNNISDNSAHYGGGIDCYWFSSPTISNNTITDNSAHYRGAGISCSYSSPTISYNTITDNSANMSGGGISCDSSSLAISNNVITYNYSANFGGGIYCYNASPTIINNIISNSLNSEGIHCFGDSIPTILYNNVWDNAGGNFYNCQPGVGDTTWGTNFNQTPCDSFYNIIRDPMFADTINYALLCSSAAIDAGDPSYEFPDSGGRRIDIGIFEYIYTMGDVKKDDKINLGDVIYLANYLLKSGTPPCPFGSGDVNCDGKVELVDVIYLANYLLKGGPKPGCP